MKIGRTSGMDTRDKLLDPQFVGYLRRRHQNFHAIVIDDDRDPVAAVELIDNVGGTSLCLF